MVDAKSGELQGRRLLVVEDDGLIAADFAYVLEERGVEVIGPAGTVAEALRLIQAEEVFDGAVLDINLGDEMVYPVADELTRRGVPFVFTSGYSALVMPTAHADVPRMEKPVDTVALARLLAGQIEAFANDAPRTG
jgi:ActR/RegA family two-component response regulator